jgi:hypothetical protein
MRPRRVCASDDCDALISDRPPQAPFCLAHATDAARKRRQRRPFAGAWVGGLLAAVATEARSRRSIERFRCRCERAWVYMDEEGDPACFKCGCLIDPVHASMVNWSAEANRYRILNLMRNEDL